MIFFNRFHIYFFFINSIYFINICKVYIIFRLVATLFFWFYALSFIWPALYQIYRQLKWEKISTNVYVRLFNTYNRCILSVMKIVLESLKVYYELIRQTRKLNTADILEIFKIRYGHCRTGSSHLSSVWGGH